MTPTHTTTAPTIRELIAEYATVEDRIRSVEARVHGGTAPPLNPELMRLAQREREILALLRSHSASEGSSTTV
jgi:hypothetical protein